MQTMKRIKAEKITVRKVDSHLGEQNFIITLIKGDEDRPIQISEQAAKCLVDYSNLDYSYPGFDVLNNFGTLKVEYLNDRVNVEIYNNLSPNEVFYLDVSVEEFKEFTAKLKELV